MLYCCRRLSLRGLHGGPGRIKAKGAEKATAGERDRPIHGKRRACSNRKHRANARGQRNAGQRGTMRGSEGPTSAASFHSRLPWNLNRRYHPSPHSLINVPVRCTSQPRYISPTIPLRQPGYYLDRLDLAYASAVPF